MCSRFQAEMFISRGYDCCTDLGWRHDFPLRKCTTAMYSVSEAEALRNLRDA